MRSEEILGLLLGVSGIVVLDLGFAGSAITDLFSLNNVIPSVPPNLGANLLGGLMPAGSNTPLFFVGGGLLLFGMVLLILYNRNLEKASISAVTPK
jgi:hypothetical protein